MVTKSLCMRCDCDCAYTVLYVLCWTPLKTGWFISRGYPSIQFINLANKENSRQCGLVLEGLLKVRLKVKDVYCKMMDNMQVFVTTWTAGSALCSVGVFGVMI